MDGVMERMPGQPSPDVLASMDRENQRWVYGQMGEIVSNLHGIDVTEQDLSVPDWGTYIREQTRTCVRRQKSSVVPDAVIEEIPDFLAQYVETRSSTSLLHTEFTYECWFVREVDGNSDVCGLLDFGDAMVGDPEADFFLSSDPEMLRIFWQAGGYPCDDPDFRYRYLAYFLLHRYATLEWMLKRHPARDFRSLEGLADRWFDV
jgi:hygromycin-B 7''-O-kinase